jgi:hypothetical protein
LEENFVGQLLGILGITTDDTSAGPPETPSERVRHDTAFALTFFGVNTREFRAAVLESGLIAATVDVALPRTMLVESVVAALSLSDNQRTQVESSIDRLLQDGRLVKAEDGLRAAEATADRMRAVHALRDAEWVELQREVGKLLRAWRGKDASPDDIQGVAKSLGALVLTAGSTSQDYLDRSIPHATVRQHIRERLRNLDAALSAAGLATAGRPLQVEQLAALVQRLDISRHLVAGELYIALSSMDTHALVRAMGADTDLSLFLDSSVAIPMLTARLYTTTNDEWSESASRLFDQLEAHRLGATLPIDYLEETASHLIAAYRDYSAFIGTDPDLVTSTNAFVAHFSQLVQAGADLKFIDYLQAFGFREHLAKANFYNARDAISQKMEALFRKYGIATRPLGKVTAHAWKAAEKEMAFAQHERAFARQRILIEHDVRTVAYLMDQEADPKTVHVLCTWDN